MATLRKRKVRGGKYFLDYRDIDGERYRVDTRTTDRKVAEVWKTRVEERLSLARLGQIEKVGHITIDDVRGTPRRADRLNLEGFKIAYQDRCRFDLDFSPSTIELIGNAMDSLIGKVGNRKIDTIDADMIRAWKRRLVREGRSKTTVSIYQRTLRAAFERAVKWGYAETNPLAGIELPKVNTSRTSMTTDEVRTLLDGISDDWFKIYIQFLLYTGCRRNEILFLRYEDIDQERWVMRVTADKTGMRLELPINTALQGVIKAMSVKKGYLFPAADAPDRPWTPGWVTHKFKREIRKAGLSESYSLHTLRHSYTTHLREKGVPRDIIQKLLGHTSPATTAGYDHSDALYFRQWADMVDFKMDE